jgi:hypothetical protein
MRHARRRQELDRLLAGNDEPQPDDGGLDNVADRAQAMDELQEAELIGTDDESDSDPDIISRRLPAPPDADGVDQVKARVLARTEGVRAWVT